MWSLIRALLPAMGAGLVQVWACDPKLMELAFGRDLFEQHGRYAGDPGDIADLLEDARVRHAAWCGISPGGPRAHRTFA